MRNSISKACVGFAILCMTPATGFADEVLRLRDHRSV